MKCTLMRALSRINGRTPAGGDETVAFDSQSFDDTLLFTVDDDDDADAHDWIPPGLGRALTEGPPRPRSPVMRMLVWLCGSSDPSDEAYASPAEEGGHDANTKRSARANKRQ
jgi:hypothetical protein